MAQVWLARSPYKTDVIGSSPIMPIKDTNSKNIYIGLWIWLTKYLDCMPLWLSQVEGARLESESVERRPRFKS